MTTIARSLFEQIPGYDALLAVARQLAVAQSDIRQMPMIYTFADGSQLRASTLRLSVIEQLFDPHTCEVADASQWLQMARRQGQTRLMQRMERGLVPAFQDEAGRWLAEHERRFVCFNPQYGLREFHLGELPPQAPLLLNQRFYTAAQGLAEGTVWGLVDAALLDQFSSDESEVMIWRMPLPASRPTEVQG